MAVEELIEGVFARAGVTASLHVVDIEANADIDANAGTGTGSGTGTVVGSGSGGGGGGGGSGGRRSGVEGRRGGAGDPEVAVRADEQVVIASIFKILLVLEFARQVVAGQLDPRERVLVRSGDRLGGWGLAGCADDAEVSLRDLAYFAMSVSDNTAADLLLRRVGADVLPMLAAELGLPRTRILGGPRHLVETMLADVGADTEAQFARILPTMSAERIRAMRVFDPAHTTSSTAREITRLLGLVWRDEAGPGAACEMVRGWMARQLFWTRLASGFPPGVRVAAKTGTLPGLHLEAGVAEYPDGGRYAIAVFARSDLLATRRIDVDLAMGEAARIAVEALRAA